MARRTVWIVSELYYPEEISTGFVITRIAEGLAGGYDVRALCGPPGYSGSLQRAARTERHQGVLIERCLAPNLDKNKVFTRIARSVLMTFALFAMALRRIGKADPVIVVTNPVSLLLSMALACRLRGARFIILVHDVFPENMVAAGMAKPDSWFLRILKRVMAIPYAAAQDIVVIGRDMGDMVAQKAGGLERKISVITNWADVGEVRPLPKGDNPFLSKLGLQGRFVVQFAGNLGRVQGLDTVVDAADRLVGEPIQFLFIGGGARKYVVEERIAQGRTNVSLLGNQPRGEQSVFLNACDVGIVSLAPGMYGLGVPSKTYNIMAAGKPIVAMVDELSEIGRLVREERIGWVVAPGDADGLARAIQDAASDGRRLAEMGARARRLAETRYSFASIARAYAELIEKGSA